MPAVRIPRYLRDLLDVDAEQLADGRSIIWRDASGEHVYEVPAGPPGPAGPSAEFGSYPSFAGLPHPGEEGYVYITQDDGHAWSWHEDTSSYEDLGRWLGSQGDVGPARAGRAGRPSGPARPRGRARVTGPAGCSGAGWPRQRPRPARPPG